MPRYNREYSIVRVVGRIWMPATTCSQVITVERYDVENILALARFRRPEADVPTVAELQREDVAQWLSTHTGDFQFVEDFEVDFSYEGHDFRSPWATEAGELDFTHSQGYDDDGA